MKRCFIVAWAILCVAAAPGAARGGQLSLHVGPVNGDPSSFPRPGLNFVDLTFTETGVPEDERLYSYDIAMRIVPPSGPHPACFQFVSGPGAVTIPPANFVLPQPPPAELTIIEAVSDSLQVNVTAEGATGDIDTGDTALRVYFTYQPMGTIGIYHLTFDPNNTVFASSEVRAIPVAVAESSLICWPEPAAVALLPPIAVLGLRPPRLRASKTS